jgi:hypothetical protein
LFSVHQTVDDYTCTSCFARDASKTASFEHKVKTFWSYSPPPSFLDFKAPSDHLQQDDNSQSYFSTNPFPKEFNTPVRIPTSPTKTPTPPPPVHSSSKRSSMESQCSLLSTPSSSTSSVTNVPSTPQKIMSNETKTWNKKKSDMNGFDLDRIQRGKQFYFVYLPLKFNSILF